GACCPRMVSGGGFSRPGANDGGCGSCATGPHTEDTGRRRNAVNTSHASSFRRAPRRRDVGPLTLAIWYGVSFAVAAAVVPICRSIALKKGFVARPRKDRWNSRPTALFGGVAIAVTVLGLALAGGD